LLPTTIRRFVAFLLCCFSFLLCGSHDGDKFNVEVTDLSFERSGLSQRQLSQQQKGHQCDVIGVFGTLVLSFRLRTRKGIRLNETSRAEKS